MKTALFLLCINSLCLYALSQKQDRSWKHFGNLLQARQRFEVFHIPDNKVLVVGGYATNNSVTNSCEIIDVNKRIVLEGPSMHCRRTEFASIVYKDSCLFVLGGYDGEKTLSTVEVYSFRTNKWYLIGSIFEPRRQHIAHLIDDSTILVIGGRDSLGTTTNTAELYNLRTHKSIPIKSFPYPLNNGYIQSSSTNLPLVFCGREDGHTSKSHKDVWMYNRTSNTWQSKGSIPKATVSPSCIKLNNGSICYSGGIDQEFRKNDLLKDIVLEKNNEFTTLTLLDSGIVGHWMCQLDDERIVIGGGKHLLDDNFSPKTFIVDIRNSQVVKGPELNFARIHAKSVLVPIIKNGSIVYHSILVISGANSKFLNSIEILDDSPTISGIINSYSSVTSVGKFPTSQIQVRDVKEFAVGDKVLIAQMQERPFSKMHSSKSLRSDFAGNHEFGRIVSINGNTIALEKQLTHHYSTLGKVQLVRVPEYGDVAVTGELTCKPWDGENGGILAFEANGTVSLQSHINVSGKGFNGAVPARETTSSLLYEDNTISTFSSTSSGEGISSSDTKMNSHTLVSNGGESGAVHNSGGAGGANTSCGGDGSLGWVSELSLNQAIASKGGKVLEYNGKKVFMGGGGGAGHSDDGEIGTGGNGGGIVFISCDNLISNDYTINANGINGKECSLDGAGGGGAAGTIYLDINNLHYPLVVNAIGGNGGNSVITNPDLPPAGSGGGGAGGVLLLKKHHNTIIAHLDGGQQGIAASVFSEHKAQSGCEGMVLDNVQIVDASSDKPDHKSFIDDCLTEDCSEYKTSKIQIQEPDNQQTSETGEASIDIHAATGYVYPNPATDRVTIYGTELDVLSLYDNMGNRFSLPFIKNENSTTIDVSSLNNGIYFVKSRNTTLSFVITK